MGKILIIGAGGQIGSELTLALREREGHENVIAADVKLIENEELQHGPCIQLDVLNKDQLTDEVKKRGVSQVYLLAALLSATAEKHPEFAWRLNMEGLFNVLNLAKDKVIDKVFWPSSIAVFGPGTPKNNTPQDCIMDPTTVYGISKQAGERWCEYYYNNFGVDVRSIRYPGLISYKTLPGGGTTDYAVDIFYKANESNKYTSFLKEDTRLPMLFMDDAVRATIELMESNSESISIRSSYNLSGLDFTPAELADEIRKVKNGFEIDYEPDFRQKIADSWPSSIDDSKARQDWGWKPSVSLPKMVDIMLKNC